jgi:hypothetical protein
LSGEPRNTNECSCLLSTKASGHDNGYVRVNLRNTQSRLPGRGNISCSPYLHQVAIIAKGELDTLRDTGKSGAHQVSHLCHNANCFNSDHLQVETSALNKDRNACQGHKIVRFYHLDDLENVRLDQHRNEYFTEYHPCAHGTRESRRRCILPVREVRTVNEFHLVNGQGIMQ